MSADGVRLRGLEAAAWNDEVRSLLQVAFEYARSAASDATTAGAPDDDPVPTLTLIAHQQHLLAPFLGWAAALAGTGELPRADAELVALRTAWLCRSLFEWREHRNYGRAAGLDDAHLEAVAAGPTAPIWTPRQRVLLQATDELHASATIASETWSALARALTAGELVEVVLVAGQYRMLSTLVNAAGSDAALAPPGAEDSVGVRIAADSRSDVAERRESPNRTRGRISGRRRP